MTWTCCFFICPEIKVYVAIKDWQLKQLLLMFKVHSEVFMETKTFCMFVFDA